MSAWAIGAWKPGAWQGTAWAGGVAEIPVVQRGSARKNRKLGWWQDFQKQATEEAKRFDMQQSQILKAQLEQERKERERILREQSAIKQRNQQLTEVLTEMKNQASAMAAQGSSIYSQINTLTQPPDPEAERRKQQALANLEKANASREAKRREEEEKRKKMLKNLEKARKARGK